MSPNELYKEKIFSTGIFIILALVTILVAIYLVIQIISGPIGTKPAPTWLLVFVTILFLASAINFSFLTISISEIGISANYGLFGKTLKWTQIKECEKDEKGYFYGYGIRFGRYKGEWIWIYNVVGGHRVVFITGSRRPRGMIISSKNPDQIIQIAKKHINNGVAI